MESDQIRGSLIIARDSLLMNLQKDTTNEKSGDAIKSTINSSED